ncbi:MAG: hypothetical protein JXA98_08825 [Methanosarcinaceae archaeon]|nr:hypothetical protein [Methanosarcinaceae archaeon]
MSINLSILLIKRACILDTYNTLSPIAILMSDGLVGFSSVGTITGPPQVVHNLKSLLLLRIKDSTSESMIKPFFVRIIERE